MSSQSSPTTGNGSSARRTPASSRAYRTGALPLSLWAQSTPGVRRLAARPDVSRSLGSSRPVTTGSDQDGQVAGAVTGGVAAGGSVVATVGGEVGGAAGGVVAGGAGVDEGRANVAVVSSSPPPSEDEQPAPSTTS